MARLNEIEIRESDVTYTKRRDWFFHLTGHHVRELLLHFLPREFVLDGSSKFCAIFGPRPDSTPVCQTILGVTVYYVEGFDVERHMTRPVEQQQEAILNELTTAMINVARSAGSDPGIIQSAAQAVRASNFSADIEVTKLARSTKDRNLRVRVFRCLSPSIGEVWEARIYGRDGTVLGIEPITQKPAHLDRTAHFSKSMWSYSAFQIVHNRLGTIEYSLDVSKYHENSR